jgi:hypothetical protein
MNTILSDGRSVDPKGNLRRDGDSSKGIERQEKYACADARDITLKGAPVSRMATNLS